MKADVVILMDESTSIQYIDFMMMKRFLDTLVHSLFVDTDHIRISLMKFSTSPEVVFRLNDHMNRSEILKGIYSLVQTGGDTYTGKALRLMMALVKKVKGSRESEGVPQIGIVITDEESTDPYDMEVSAHLLRKHGISLMGIGIQGASKKELLMITGNPENVFLVDTFGDMKRSVPYVTQSL